MNSPNTSPPKRRGRPPKVKEAPAPTPPSQGEMVVSIPLTELHPFPNHPFKVRDDEAMKETTESVKEYGVLTPAIVRPREKGGYEIVAGHRRKRACELAGLAALPALVRNLDDDTATILMVDSNIQRENILPSERAQAYKMKLEAIKRRGARTDLTSPNNSAKLRSDNEIGAAMGMSGDSIPILSPNPSPLEQEAAAPPERKRKEAEAQTAFEIYREIIKENIDYDILIQDTVLA